MIHMSYQSRLYNHRNAHTHEQDNQKESSPFFNKAANQTAAGNGKPAFFQAKPAVNAPGDSYEKEADAVAARVVNNAGNTPVVQQKEISSLQRMATSDAEEALSTDEERMKRDKEIQTKPAATPCMDC
jgi:predicted Zn-dependent protease